MGWPLIFVLLSEIHGKKELAFVPPTFLGNCRLQVPWKAKLPRQYAGPDRTLGPARTICGLDFQFRVVLQSWPTSEGTDSSVIIAAKMTECIEFPLSCPMPMKNRIVMERDVKGKRSIIVLCGELVIYNIGINPPSRLFKTNMMKSLLATTGRAGSNLGARTARTMCRS